MINWSPNSMLLILKYQVLADQLLKHRFEEKIEDVDKKLPNTNGLVRKNDYITKVTEPDNKIPSVTG